MPDTQDHTALETFGKHTPMLGCNTVLAGPVLQGQALGELKDALTSCTFNRGSPNGTKVPALPSKWMADGSQG